LAWQGAIAGGGESLFCGGRGGRLLETVGAAELLAESLDATGCVDEFLLSGEEGVAGATDIDVDLWDSAAGDERVATGAVDVAISIFGVDFGFHGQISFSSVVREAKSATRQPGYPL